MSAITHGSRKATSAGKRLKKSPNDQALVSLNGQMVRTTSLLIAEKFGKRHDNVLRDIDNLECSEEFRALNFEGADYIDAQGKPRKMVGITRDGFSFLAMGFTGRGAAAWKERFIAAFSHMESELLRLARQKHDPTWQSARLAGIAQRKDFADTVRDFVEYAREQGSSNAERYWPNTTVMIYSVLFGRRTIDRDALSPAQIGALQAAELVAALAIREGISNEMHYKSIFQRAKARVEGLKALAGGALLLAH